MTGSDQFSKRVECGHCHNSAPMRIVAIHPDTMEYEEKGTTWTAGNVFELLKCPACSAMTLRSYYWHDGLMDPGDDRDYQVLYPSERGRPRGLPDRLATDYEA